MHLTSDKTFARLCLLAFLLGTAACVATALTRPAPVNRPGEGDAALYRAIVDRVHHGEAYYDAAGAELRARNYGLRSVLNWRPPTLALLSAHAPAKGILSAIAGTTLLLAIVYVREQSGPILTAAVALCLASALITSLLGDTYLFSELWTGILIALSILLYATDRPLLAVLPALAAVFIRELALLYAFLLLFYLLLDQRGTAAALLLSAGLILYSAFFVWHAKQVVGHILPSDPVYPTGYLQFLGLPFLLSVARQDFLLLITPLWLTALWLPVSLMGLISISRRPRALFLPATLAYLACFAALGKDFNDYWGLVVAPCLAMAVPFGPVELRRLLTLSLPPTITPR